MNTSISPDLNENKTATEYLEHTNQQAEVETSLYYNIKTENKFESVVNSITPPHSKTTESHTITHKHYTSTPVTTEDNTPTNQTIDFNIKNNKDNTNDITPTTHTEVDTKENEWQEVTNKKVTQPAQNIKEYNIPQIIIDNITTKLNQDQLTTQTKEIFKNKIKDIKFLKRGGMVITPSDPAATNSILKPDNYPTDTFGQDPYIHLTKDKTDLRPWLCVNQVAYNQDNEHQTLQNIKQKLRDIKTKFNDNNIIIEGIHRKFKGQLPTTLILFKTTEDISQNELLKNKIAYNNQILNIRMYIDKRQIQCTNCQKIGHLKKQCKNKHACVRCGKSCPPSACQSEVLQKCINCKGDHSSTYKNCPVLKQHIQGLFETKKSQSYAEALAKQQTQLFRTQTQQSSQITDLHNKQTTIDTLNDTIKKQDTLINKQHEEITKLINLIDKQNETIKQHETSINDLAKSIKIINESTKIQSNNTTMNHALSQNISTLIAEAIYTTKNLTSRDQIIKQTRSSANRINNKHQQSLMNNSKNQSIRHTPTQNNQHHNTNTDTNEDLLFHTNTNLNNIDITPASKQDKPNV